MSSYVIAEGGKAGISVVKKEILSGKRKKRGKDQESM
jgi:hypothetical protein